MALPTGNAKWPPRLVVARDATSLDKDQVRHLKAFRHGFGEPVWLLDGQGNLDEATVDGNTITSRKAIETNESSNREIAISLIDRNSLKESIRNAVACGATTIHIVAATNSASSNGQWNSGVETKATQWAHEVMKQSLVLTVPIFVYHESFEQLLESVDNIVVMHQTGTEQLSASAVPAIGPEGGWTPDELAMCKAKDIAIARLSLPVLTAPRAVIAALTTLSQQ